MKLVGRLNANSKLSGCLNVNGGLSGVINQKTQYPFYNGNYNVVPKAYNTQTLQTKNMVLREDVTVEKIPYSETQNPSGGTTIFIADI